MQAAADTAVEWVQVAVDIVMIGLLILNLSSSDSVNLLSY